MERILALAELAGFTLAAPVEMSALVPLPQVREMCAAGRCQVYGRSWSCPPACGTLEQCAARMSKYHRGVLVQTTGEMEDDFDLEAIARVQGTIRRRFWI